MLGITFKTTKNEAYQDLLRMYANEFKEVNTLEEFKTKADKLFKPLPYLANWVGDPKDKDAYLNIWIMKAGAKSMLLAEVRKINRYRACGSAK